MEEKENKLIEELSTLTTIETNAFNSLLEKVKYIISNDIYESVIDNDEITSIDLGIGKLLIKTNEEEIKYKFIPSDDLQKSIKQVVNNKSNPLKNTLEKTLVDRITNTYKDLL